MAKFFSFLKRFSLMIVFGALCASLSANTILQDVKITVNRQNATISRVLDDIEEQTGYSILVRNNDIDLGRTVSVNAKNKPIQQVLDMVFAGSDVRYEVRGKTITVYKPNASSSQQVNVPKGVVMGTIIDKDNVPVIGASVIDTKNKTNGSITGDDGKFSLRLSDNSTAIEVSCMGYKTQIIPVSGAENLNIVLADDTERLDEVVVVGYMTQKKGLVTGSVASMKVDENLKTIPTTSAGNILVGKLAGVSVSTPNAIPGSAPGISIRTGASWNAENVTYVIDGVVRGSGDFNNLSPNEIEDITVLKDAASAAIYGSRSAGGVIIVTTKKGTRGKPTFNYSFGYSVDSRTKNEKLTDAVQTGELYNRINGTADPAAWAWSQEELDYIATINDGWGYDQLDIVWRNPTTESHNFSVNGGGEKVRYFAAASYVRQEGFLKPLTYDKYNVRLNVTADVTKNLQVFTGLALYDDYQGNAVFENAYANYSKLRVWQPDQPVYTDGGLYVDYGWIANMGAAVDGKGGYNKSQMLKPQAVFSATYNAPFLPGLSAKVSYSRSWVHSVNRQFYINYDLQTMKKSGPNNHIVSTDDNDIISTRKSTWVNKDYIQRYSGWSDDKQFNFQLSYDNTFGGVHHVAGTFVTEWYEGKGTGVTGGRETFPVYTTDQFWAASSAREDTWGSGNTDWKSGRMSYIGQFTYSYANKYLASFSFREDGSMNFAPDQRWGFFPAGSLGWVMSEENFFNKEYVQYLKLRASIGLTGNDSVGGWQWQESYYQGYSAYFGTTPSRSVGIRYGNVVNKKLTWEKSLSYNFGLDMNFLNHFNTSIDYWFRNAYDILGNRQNTLPSTFSLSMPAENYGEVHAQGFDFQLGYRGQTNDFTYFANLTASYGWNKVIKKDYAENAQWIDIPEGKSTSYITGYKFDKIIRTQEELDEFIAAHPNYNHNGLSPELGMMVYEDISGPDGEPDGYINSWDRIILKKRNNPVVYGLNIGGSWKGLSIDMMFSGNLGQKKWIYDLCEGVEWNRMWIEWYDNSWTPDNPNATYPKRISANNSKTYDEYTGFWLKDASFMRLKYMTISYDLPKGQFYNKVFDNIRLYVTGTNLFVLSKFNRKYYDPEIGNGNSFPVLRSWNFGIDVKF
jgi:TonB-linked SusC/RagA family outer membrane protein